MTISANAKTVSEKDFSELAGRLGVLIDEAAEKGCFAQFTMIAKNDEDSEAVAGGAAGPIGLALVAQQGESALSMAPALCSILPNVLEGGEDVALTVTIGEDEVSSITARANIWNLRPLMQQCMSEGVFPFGSKEAFYTVINTEGVAGAKAMLEQALTKADKVDA